MKAHGGWFVWLVLAVCAATVFGAMTWLTRKVVASERDRSSAEARADLEQRMRMALWRMDTAGAAIITDESQQPAGELPAMPVVVPSTPAKMRFELAENGAITARQGEEHLAELNRLLRADGKSGGLFAAACISLEAGGMDWAAKVQVNEAQPPPATVPPQMAESAKVQQSKEPGQQAYYNETDRIARGRAVDDQVTKSQNLYKNVTSNAGIQPQAQTLSRRLLLDAGPLRPSWIGGELFLLRRVLWSGVPSSSGRTIQGVWIDSAELKKRMLATIVDLLPSASLSPASGTTPDDMVLASFPWRLEAGMPAVPAALPRPILISLAAGWAAALLALGAASFLVRGVMRLSERRASFVSAVTHELRTPLTTFRLYSDMLEAGAVKEEKRGDYLRVLTREADRLSHLVENVLAFSRIERGSARTAVRETNARDLLEPMRERFATRLAAGGLTLEMDLSPDAVRPLRTDAAAVEHVLFNLVDNAAKYAATPAGAAVTVEVGARPHGVTIRVSDRGPGIPAPERKRIFRAFHKSARDAAETRPGVGLGLALSRRLARSLGGDLRYEDNPSGGASFILSLPA